MYMKTQNNHVINIKIDAKTKAEAQQVAEDLGFSLSSLLKGYLKQLIHTKKVSFALPKEERLSKWAVEQLRRADEDVQAGRVSPAFTTAEEAAAWLDDPHARYQNGDPAQ